MKSDKRNKVALIGAWLLSLGTALAQTPPASGLYPIISGTFVQKGGFASELRTPVPNPAQAFIDLSVDQAAGTAELTFLGTDFRAGFSKLTNGVIAGSTIRFHYQIPEWDFPPLPAPATVDYVVTNDAGSLWISGSVTCAVVCCDFPYGFEHQSVQAMLPLPPTIRVSEIELCWSSISNESYQVQYRSELTGNQWTNLNSAVLASSPTTCLTDKVPPGEPRRFYRVLSLP